MEDKHCKEGKQKGGICLTYLKNTVELGLDKS